MRIDTFKNVLEEHGVTLKAHTWDSLLKEIESHPRLPSPAVGSDGGELGEVLQKLYVSSGNGVHIGFLKSSKGDLIHAARFIQSRYNTKAAEAPQMPRPKYVSEWNEIITAIDSARSYKKQAMRQTPHMDQFTEGAPSKVGIASLLEGLLEGNKEAQEALKEVLLTDPVIKNIPGHTPPEDKHKRPGVIVIT